MLIVRPSGFNTSVLDAVKQFFLQINCSWFAIVMGTGGVGVMIAKFPYEAPAQQEIGWAFWWLAVLQFVVFAAALLSRCVLFPSSIKPLLSQPLQHIFLSSIPMALGVIAEGMPVFMLRYWPADSVNTGAAVLWTIAAVVGVLLSVLVPLVNFTREEHSWPYLTGAWLMPILPGVLMSAAGGLVAQPCGDDAARRIVLACCFLWGISVPLILMLTTLYLGRLLLYRLPPKESLVSSFLPVAGISMGGLGLLNLGTVMARPAGRSTGSGGDSSVDLAGGEETLFLYGAILEQVGAYAALLLWGASAWWLMVAVVSVGATLRELPFNMGWWGSVFPMSTFSLTAIVLSDPAKLGSGALKVAAAAFAALTLAQWCVITALTAWHAWRGDIFATPSGASKYRLDGLSHSGLGAPDLDLTADLAPQEPAAEGSSPSADCHQGVSNRPRGAQS